MYTTAGLLTPNFKTRMESERLLVHKGNGFQKGIFSHAHFSLVTYLHDLTDSINNTDWTNLICENSFVNITICCYTQGAIMFGDKLLPSECSLIVEELKRTSLCFQVSFITMGGTLSIVLQTKPGLVMLDFLMQCAHGRPTTVPLVNLKALHKAILQLGSWREHSENTWHGLCRKEINLDRAKRRLDVARGCE